MKLKHFFVSILSLVFFSLSSVSVFALESITSFQSNVVLNQDTTLSITETINYQTDSPHHGIYRYIPTKVGDKYSIRSTAISDIKVTDVDGDRISFQRSYSDGNVTLKIGDPDRTFTGPKTYVISYTIADIFKSYSDYDEVYLDITGEGWNFPIRQTNVNFTSEFADITNLACYSGQYGGDDSLCSFSQQSDSQADFSYSETINREDNISIVVALDKSNSLLVPTKLQKLIKTLTDNVVFFFILLPLFVFIYLWYKKGRDLVFVSPNVFNLDPKRPQQFKPLFKSSRTPFVYEPLKLTPGEAGTIIDEKADLQDVVAEILDLARQGYLKITKIKAKSIFSKDDYLFTKKKKSTASLPEHQLLLFNSIFSSKDEIKLSQLKGKFYKQLPQIQKAIFASLDSKGLFTAPPRKVQTKYSIIAVILNLVVYSIFIPTFTSSSYLPTIIFPLLGVQVFLTLLLVRNMVQKTAVGYNYYLQAKGLKQTIKTGKWREEIKEKNLFIEEVLPFAVSLGVVTKLASDMAVLGVETPAYFVGFTSPSTFARDFSNFTTQASSGLSYNPQSGRSSSGSGFSGGGFSGGGGGGGGGGSW